MPVREKERRLTIGQRADIIQSLLQGEKHAVLGRKYQVRRQAISAIWKKREAILSIQGKVDPLKKRIQDGKFPVLESRLLQLLSALRRRKFNITTAVIEHCATAIAAELGLSEVFRCSETWIKGFRDRNQLQTIRSCHGSANSVDAASVRMKILGIAEKLSSYSQDQIFNVDESALFFRCLPKRTIIVPGIDGDGINPGIRYSSDKSRVSIVLCVNASGTTKVPMLVIGKAKRPRCLKKFKFPSNVTYASQSQAWLDGHQFQLWFRKVFKPSVVQYEKVALVLDNASQHFAVSGDEQVSLFFLPPNSTSLVQPLDLGIIALLKRTYRKELLLQYVDDIDFADELFQFGKTLPPGEAGIDNFHPPNIADAIRLLSRCWNALPALSVQRCFSASGLILNCSTGDSEPSLENDIEREMSRLLSGIQLGENRLQYSEREAVFESLNIGPPSLVISAVQQWLSLEDNKVTSNDKTLEEEVSDFIGTVSFSETSSSSTEPESSDDDGEVIEQPSAISEVEVAEACKAFVCSAGRVVQVVRDKMKNINAAPNHVDPTHSESCARAREKLEGIVSALQGAVTTALQLRKILVSSLKEASKSTPKRQTRIDSYFATESRDKK